MSNTSDDAALDRARRKAFRRLIPLVFISYVIAYVDRTNVALAKFGMEHDLPGFTAAVFGFGAGVFFIGYTLLEIPGSLLVERWSARKWISRIMISWGLMAALTAAVTTPMQFYVVRFLLGLAEAGFFPGVIVYLSHWFPTRDRARALSFFFIAAPIAQIVSPKISYYLLRIGTDEEINGALVSHPELLGLEGWQWMYIFWAAPALVCGVVVLFALTDRPAQARWLTPEEREALQRELAREREAQRDQVRHMGVLAALAHPKVLLLAAAYFFFVTANYGIEFFMPTILKAWYGLEMARLTWLVMVPFAAMLAAQLLVGWHSDRKNERWLHTAVPLAVGAVGLALVPSSSTTLALTVACFSLALAGLRACMPGFWSLPNLFLSEAAAAGSIGFINAFGNLGGFLGPTVLGKVQSVTGSFVGGMYFLVACAATSSLIVFGMRWSALRANKPRREPPPSP